jgi:hypothetical protein
MKSTINFGLILVFVLFLVGCGEETADSPTPEIQGPALVMFYTDN